MNVLILLSYFTIMVSAVSARPNAIPPLLSQGEATQATNQIPEALTPAPLSPKVVQPQSRVHQQPDPQGQQLLPPTQHYTLSPLGGSPMVISLQPSTHGSQPLILSPYGYFSLFSSPFTNQLFSPYGFPMILASPVQQTPASQPPNSLVLPAETPSGAAPSGSALQQIQQQQNPQIVYMLQQPMASRNYKTETPEGLCGLENVTRASIDIVNSALGSISSEELQMAARMGQLGVYLPNVLTNPSSGAVQPANQAAGLTNPEQQGIMPTVGTSSAGVPRMQGPASSGLQSNTKKVPSGLEKTMKEGATVQTPVQPIQQRTQGNLV